MFIQLRVHDANNVSIGGPVNSQGDKLNKREFFDSFASYNCETRTKEDDNKGLIWKIKARSIRLTSLHVDSAISLRDIHYY